MMMEINDNGTINNNIALRFHILNGMQTDLICMNCYARLECYEDPIINNFQC